MISFLYPVQIYICAVNKYEIKKKKGLWKSF